MEQTITDKIQSALEDALLKVIRSDTVFKMEYNNRIDASDMIRKAYALVDYNRVIEKMKVQLEQELAEKIVNKIITEMGTDVKNLMSNATVRDDLKFFMRKGVEEVLNKVKLNETKGSAV